jgi:hypothetical protein
MVIRSRNRYDSKEWIYMEYMDKDSMNKSKSIYSRNKESDDKVSMCKCNIEIRHNIEYIYNYV